MKYICLFIKWITFGYVCLGHCSEEKCCESSKCDA